MSDTPAEAARKDALAWADKIAQMQDALPEDAAVLKDAIDLAIAEARLEQAERAANRLIDGQSFVSDAHRVLREERDRLRAEVERLRKP